MLRKTDFGALRVVFRTLRYLHVYGDRFGVRGNSFLIIKVVYLEVSTTIVTINHAYARSRGDSRENHPKISLELVPPWDGAHPGF